MSESLLSWSRISKPALSLSIALMLCSGCHDGQTSDSAANQTPVAPVSLVSRAALQNTLKVAGEFIPYQEVELHAEVAGYIRHIYVDIGDHVKAGQVLAVLDVPQLVAQVQGASAGVRQSQEQITRARSEVLRAQANYQALHSQAQRLLQASNAQPGLIAAQELDNAQANDRAAAAQVDSAKSALAAMQQQLGVSQADRQRYASLEDYSRITAPFSGVVTWRYADTGALIQAGTSNAGSMPVLKLAQVDVLRLRLPVPESIAPFVHVGDTAQVFVQAIGKSFTGTVSRDTASLDPSTRTMQVEIDLPNPNGTLEPGMYAQVTLDVHHASGALTVPVEAVSRSTAQPWLLVVDSTNHVQRREVQLGITTANRVQIVSGVREGEKVIAAKLGSFQPGELVQPKLDTMAAFNDTEAQ